MAEAVSADHMSTEEFVRSLEEDLRVQGRWLADHPLVSGLERGSLSRGQIAGLMGQIYRQTIEVVRWLGACYAYCPDMAVRRDLFNNLVEEELGGFSNTEAHFHLAARCAVAAGAKRDELDSVELRPATEAIISYGDNLFYDRSNWIVPFGAFFGFEYQSPGAYGKIAEALKSSYGMSTDDAMFFEVHVTADEDHSDSIIRVLDKYIKTEEDREMIRRHSNQYAELYYKMLSTYEAYN